MSDPRVELFRYELRTFGSKVEHTGLAAAFALVACADGTLSDEERARWDELIPATGETAAVRQTFDELTARLLRNFKDARRRTFDALRAVADEGEQASRRVLHAAQIALVADDKIDESEERLVEEIAAALGLPPHEA